MKQSGSANGIASAHPRARVAIDLGAESCRVSLLRWSKDEPVIELTHRIPNGPVHVAGSLRWPLTTILAGLEEGLRTAAAKAPEGIASIAVDGWAVDYVRLRPDGQRVGDPFCYRDERTVGSKESSDRIVDPERMFCHSGAQPLRINTVYQLLADDPEISSFPWVNLPEYVLHWLGGRRVAEYTNATHTGLIDLATGQWSNELLQSLALPGAAMPPIVLTGSVIGKLKGKLAELPALSDAELIVPACHDTASAIAAIPSSLEHAAYICSGTWSLVGTCIDVPLATPETLRAGFTNQGAADGGFCFHTNVNGMWILKQCMETWRKAGHPWEIDALVAEAARRDQFPGTVPVDAPSLLLDDNMPARLNEQLRQRGHKTIEDRAGNEPVFARVIFESLAERYDVVLRDLEGLLGTSLNRIYVLGGGGQNQLLTRLTAERTGLTVETGDPESSTLGNFAIQLAASEAQGNPLRKDAVQRWAHRLAQARRARVAV